MGEGEQATAKATHPFAAGAKGWATWIHGSKMTGFGRVAESRRGDWWVFTGRDTLWGGGVRLMFHSGLKAGLAAGFRRAWRLDQGRLAVWVLAGWTAGLMVMDLGAD
jgi:hypothetical protein